MRALPLAALAVLLALPASTLAGLAPEPVPVPLDQLPAADPSPASHGAIAPYMHIAALDIPAGIRPGAWLQIGPSDCTAAFVVKDPAGALYITTAAHCTQRNGQRVAVTQDTLVAALEQPVEFGTVVASWPQGLDAALIRIDADKYGMVNPSMPGWGGPTGLVTSIPSEPVVIKHYGWGWYTWMDHATRCRAGVSDADGPAPLTRWSSSTFWYAGVVGNGDSGSAVMTEDGRALGILDWGGVVIPTPLGPFVSLTAGGVRFDRALQAFAATTGKTYTLVEGGPVNPVCLPEPPLPVE